MADERLQKLERQREALQAKIQKEAQIKEMKAQKKREAQEARELEQAKAKEMLAQKEALKAERKMQKEIQAQEKRQQKQAQKDFEAERKALKIKPYLQDSTQQYPASNDTNTQKSTTKEYQAYRKTQNPNDKNSWFIAIAPNASAMAVMLNAAYPTLWNFGLGEYGVAFESGYNFGKGADRWRVHFGLGYKWARSVEYDERDELYDLHTITHTVGLDWTPRLGSSSVRGVLGFSKYFSYMIDKGYENSRYYSYNLLPYYNYNLRIESVSHILWIGVSTRLGFIFDIKEHFSIEIGSKINLAVSLLGFLDQQYPQGSTFTSQNRFIFGASILGSLEQYLSLAYRF